LQKLFNLPPAPEAQYINDKQGNKYWVNMEEDDYGIRVILSFYGRGIGCAKLSWDKSSLNLGDFVIWRHNLRGNGVGSSLLKEVIKIAKHRGAKSIKGFIHPETSDGWEYLFDWYERQGFEVDRDKATFYMELTTSS
jgi:GNAT superfamily N-acetyltransferase